MNIEVLINNLLSPVILSFVLGVVAKLTRSDLAFPEALSKTLAIFLLLAIGMKGGMSLSAAQFHQVIWAVVATVVIGLLIPGWTYFIARQVGRLGIPDAASFAGHYGSTSAVTFLAAMAFLSTTGQPAEGFMPALLAVMEVPAIVVALVLLRRFQDSSASTQSGSLMSVVGHVLASKSILLLIGGLVIGWAAGRESMAEVKAFFVDPFKGVLCLFLLELGMVAAGQLGELRARWRFILPFATFLPLLHGCLGVFAGYWSGLSPSGATVLGVLAASASYIAAPAAMRLANPTANHALALAASLGVTFPFNLVIGIPLYHSLAVWLG